MMLFLQKMQSGKSDPEEGPGEEVVSLMNDSNVQTVRFVRSPSRISTGMSSPTEAFRSRSIDEAEVPEVRPVNQDHWDKSVILQYNDSDILSSSDPSSSSSPASPCLSAWATYGDFPLSCSKMEEEHFSSRTYWYVWSQELMLKARSQVLLFFGRPLYLLELGIGQFSSKGAAPMWDMVPAFRGRAFVSCASVTINTVQV